MNAPRPPVERNPGARTTWIPGTMRGALSSLMVVMGLMVSMALTAPLGAAWAAAPAVQEARPDAKAAPRTPAAQTPPPKASAKPATTAAASTVPTAKLQPGSEIVFVSKQLGVPVEGRFGRFEAQIALDPRNPATGRVAFSIDTASASIGDAETDRELAKPDWFGVARFPQASFESTAIKALGGGRFEVAGRLSIKGTVRDAVVPVTLTQTGANSLAVGSFSIQRNAFGIGGGAWADTSLVADEVQVKFKLSLTGLGPL